MMIGGRPWFKGGANWIGMLLVWKSWGGYLPLPFWFPSFCPRECGCMSGGCSLQSPQESMGSTMMPRRFGSSGSLRSFFICTCGGSFVIRRQKRSSEGSGPFLRPMLRIEECEADQDRTGSPSSGPALWLW